MKNLKNEKGIALITALLLTLISLVVLGAVLYLLTRNIQVSAAHKRYKNVLEASYGGAAVFTSEIIDKSMRYTDSEPPLDPLLGTTFSRYTGCFQKKLTHSTMEWEALGCAPAAMTLDPTDTPDAKFTLQGLPNQPNFKVYSKIVDTIVGNSNDSGIELENGAGVAYTHGLTPPPMPGLFRIEIQGERENNTKEKARLTVFYQY